MRFLTTGMNERGYTIEMHCAVISNRDFYSKFMPSAEAN